MATIALYANKMNQMPGLFNEIKTGVTDYKAELLTLQTKALNISKSVCDLSDVISSIQSSTQIQEEKVDSLTTFEKNSEEFISNVVSIDNDVADVVNKRKDEFYEEYSYLKPECEKTWQDKVKDWFDSAAEWCKEHWKILVTVAIVIVAIILIATGVGGILGLMAIGALIGAGVGGLCGGIMSMLTGGSFWEGFENGAFAGAVSGMLAAGLAAGLTGGASALTLTLKQTLAIGGLSESGTQLLTDLGEKFIGGEDISLGEMIFNAGFAGVCGAVFSGVGYGLSKGFTALKTMFKSKFGAGVNGGSKTVITPEMEEKILLGQRKSPTKNELIGGHSPDINNSNPNYAVEVIQTNVDGTQKVKFVTQYADGNLSNIKTSTLFPEGWSNDKIISSIKAVGDLSPIGVRTSDGAMLFRDIIDRVQIEVIKIGDIVTSAYPTGGIKTGLLPGFINLE